MPKGRKCSQSVFHSEDITVSAEWTSATQTLPPPLAISCVFPGVPQNLIFLQNSGSWSERGKISQPYRETRGKKVRLIYLCKTWEYYISPFCEKNASHKEKRWNLGTNNLLHDFIIVFLGYNASDTVIIFFYRTHYNAANSMTPHVSHLTTHTSHYQ